MSELERLEETLEESLFFHYAILNELIDMAFVDLMDFLETKSVIGEDGNERRELQLKENVEPHSGVEIILRRDGFTIRAPYRMKALDFLCKYFDVLGTDQTENTWKQKIHDEMEKTKLAIKIAENAAL